MPSTSGSSPLKERPAGGSTIVVGGHVEGSDMFPAVGGGPVGIVAGEMRPSSGSKGSQKSSAMAEEDLSATPTATVIPAANVFAIPANHSSGSHRRSNSQSTTPVNLVETQAETSCGVNDVEEGKRSEGEEKEER